MAEIDQIKELLRACTLEQRKEIWAYLRNEFPIHPIEAQLNLKAEVILEAIARSSDLILRGIRGVIAEAAFETYVLNQLQGWTKIPLLGDRPFDFLLEQQSLRVRIQVKMQRLKAQKPMTAKQAYQRLPEDMYVVETQRTRGGKNLATGEETRPYRFGDFDILAVSMHPSTNDWTSFMYTVSDWLLPRSENKTLMLKFQPVAPRPNSSWTDDLETCIAWLKSGQKKTIQ